MPAKVTDDSVIVAMAFEEPQANEAEVLLEGADLAAPTLLAYELTSAARKKALLYPDQVDTVWPALQRALQLDIRWMEVDHPAVLRLALETGLTTYDTSYLYLARLLSAPLVTFDKTLSAAVRDRGGLATPHSQREATRPPRYPPLPACHS